MRQTVRALIFLNNQMLQMQGERNLESVVLGGGGGGASHARELREHFLNHWLEKLNIKNEFFV
jgi:hypothetical protein